MALRHAQKAVQAARGFMLWRQVSGKSYLIRTNIDNSQKSLGARSLELDAAYEKFMARRKMPGERIAGFRQTLQLYQQLNRAHRVGRTTEIVVKILNRLYKSGINECQRALHHGGHAKTFTTGIDAGGA